MKNTTSQKIALARFLARKFPLIFRRFENVLERVVEVQEWANVFWIKVKGMRPLFVSKNNILKGEALKVELYEAFSYFFTEAYSDNYDSRYLENCGELVRLAIDNLD